MAETQPLPPEARPEPPGMMTPQEIVHELDKNIVGQADAKRAVAIALRNRWRRSRVFFTEISSRSRMMESTSRPT